MKPGFWQSQYWQLAGRWSFAATQWMLRLPVWPFTVPRVRVVIVAEGHVLVVKQWFSDGQWELPGGGIHAGETSFEAARREVDEEVGIEMGELEEHGLYRPVHRACSWQLVSAALDTRPLLLVTRPYEILEARWLPITELGGETVEKSTRDIVATVIAQEIIDEQADNTDE